MKKLMSRNEYDKYMKELPDGQCTFCDWEEHQIILHVGYEWVWIANFAPYWNYHTMLIPKRHIEEFGEMTDNEAVEFKQLMKLAMARYRERKLKRSDGSIINKFVYFWRKRDVHVDPRTGGKRPAHWHVHLCPDKDHLWDPIISDKAKDWDVKLLK